MKYTKTMIKTKSGFTIVELLIVVVVIAILAAITVVSFTGIQQQARDSQRLQDVKTIAKALELYYIDRGEYPAGSCTANCKINGYWSSTSDGSWSLLESQLVPKYISKMPTDPQAGTDKPPGISGGSNYDYVTVGLCGKPMLQSYLLTYRLEGSAQKVEAQGSCTTANILDYGPSSEYGVGK